MRDQTGPHPGPLREGEEGDPGGRGVEGVVLAAGLSSRTGERYKMALPFGGRSVIEQAIVGMYGVVERILVVVGWQGEVVRELLAGYPRVEFVVNEAFREGMFSSVRAGVAQVRAARFFLLPGDHPLVGEGVYRQMLAVEGEVVIPTYHGRKGHPILLSSRTIPAILAQPPEATLRDVIRQHGFTPVEVEEEGVLLDLDTIEDYEALRARQ